jgi:hypothetical protein
MNETEMLQRTQAALGRAGVDDEAIAAPSTRCAP